MKKFLAVVSLLFVGAVSALIAGCKPGGSEKYTYTFNSNGAVFMTIEDEAGTELTFPTPTLSGYEFEGWYSSQNYTGTPQTSAIVSGNQNYYAKWAKLCDITLNLDGGSLSATSLQLKEGANVSEFMADYSPTKGSLQFGGWYMNGSPLSSTYKMTTAGVTLTAKYKAQYTVEKYVNNGNGSYDKQTENFTDYALVGESFTPSVKVTGFKKVSNPNEVVTKVISQTASDNVFKIYYDYEEYRVAIKPNFPNGTGGDLSVVNVRYDEDVILPVDLKFDGYQLIGWSKMPSGANAIAVDTISHLIYGSEGEAPEPLKVNVSESTNFYAVWSKGYIDVFGGGDLIFLINNQDGNKLYIKRGETFFEGTYRETAKAKQFFLYDGDGETIVLSGILNDNGTYVYSDPSRGEISYVEYVRGQGVNKDSTILFDEYNGIEYYPDGGSTQKSSGTYVINADGTYTVTFTAGKLDGQTVEFITGDVLDTNGTVKRAFQLCNKDEVNLGKLNMAVQLGENLMFYPTITLEFDGYATATMTLNQNRQSFYYDVVVLEDNRRVAVLRTSDNSVYGIYYLDTSSGIFVEYNEELDKEFTSSTGAVLALDGTFQASYTDGGVTVTGSYVVDSSVFGSVIVTFYPEGGADARVFMANRVNNPDYDKDTPNSAQYLYTAEEKPADYHEYFYLGNDGLLYYSPLIIMSDNGLEEGQAHVYAFRRDGSYVKALLGTVTSGSVAGSFIFTVTERYIDSDDVSFVDLSTLKSFVFAVDSEAGAYAVNYWYSSTTTGDLTVNYERRYTAADNSTLTLVGGFAFVDADGEQLVSGVFSQSGNVITVTAAENGESVIYYYAVSGDTFEQLDELPQRYGAIDIYRKVTETEYIQTDGKGGAVYSVGGVNYSGVIAKQDGDFGGLEVYSFTGSAQSFTYILYSNANGRYFYKRTLNKTFTNASAASQLTLDGFGYKLTYGGNAYYNYIFVGENTLTVTMDGATRYFDINKSASTFTLRDEFYGTYMFVDNNLAGNVYFEFDGYGTLKVYTRVKVGEEWTTVYVDEHGTYLKDGDEFAVAYADGTQQSFRGKFRVINTNLSAILAFVRIHPENEMTVVVEVENLSTDDEMDHWSMLFLSGDGSAKKYDGMGREETGIYTFITDSLFYYANDKQTDANLYRFDRAEGTAERVTDLSSGRYFTEDFEVLNFTKYGFVMDGVVRDFYTADESGNVTIYHQNGADGGANQYGFTSEQFGKFESVKTYHGKQYFKIDGALRLTRDEYNKDLYPFITESSDGTNRNVYKYEEIVFIPAGTAEFSVNATIVSSRYEDGVKKSSLNESCTVNRVIDKDTGEATVFIQFTYLRFDIEISLNASEKTYSIHNEEWAFEMYSAEYLYNWYVRYYFNGSQSASALKNTMGYIERRMEFDSNGEETADYLNLGFGEDSGMYDSQGNLMEEFLNVPYTASESGWDFYCTLEADDGFNYDLHIQRVSMLRYGISAGAFEIVSCERVEKLSAGGYTVTLNKLTATENPSATLGSVRPIKLEYGGAELKFDTYYVQGNILWIIANEGGEVSGASQTTYYKVTLTENGTTAVPDGKTQLVPTYASITVVSEVMDVVETSDKLHYAVKGDTFGVVAISYFGRLYYATSSTYDAGTDTYTVITANGTYKVKISGGTATITTVQTQA